MREGNEAVAMASKKKQASMSDSEVGGNAGKGVTRKPVQNKRKNRSGRREAGVSEGNGVVAMARKKKQASE